LENEKVRDPTGPSTATVKRLFAQSGNRCAFPSCPLSIIDGATIVGEICHIKAANARGPRYDPDQTAAERRGYGNLILLCRNHHVVVDDDPEAYTVERLIKMKTDHEQRTSLLSDEQAEKGIGLLIDQSVTASNQSGGIIANTVNINLNVPPSQQQPAAATVSTRFLAAEPKDGPARFRRPDQPLGVHRDSFPFSDTPDSAVFLSKGSAMWLRLMPKVKPERDWSTVELRACNTAGVLTLQPFCNNDLRSLLDDDGYGTYSNGPRASETMSVAFAFETGEVWSVDTALLTDFGGRNGLYFDTISKVFVERLRNYGTFLGRLGVAPPYDWIAGLEGVKGRRLQIPPPQNYTSISLGNPCLSKAISCNGSYDPKVAPAATLRPFFEQICRKCDTPFPDYLEL
jgi:hypothetical protein